MTVRLCATGLPALCDSRLCLALQYKTFHLPTPGNPTDVVAPPIGDSLPAVVGGLGIVVAISVVVSVIYLWRVFLPLCFSVSPPLCLFLSPPPSPLSLI